MAYHVAVRDIPKDQRPRERLEQFGSEALGDEELLAIILGSGPKGISALELARGVLHQCGNLTALERWSVKEMQALYGVGPVKAIEIKAAIEVGRRVVSRDPELRANVRTPEDIWMLVRGEMSTLEQEQLRVVLLNTKNQVQGVHLLYKGTVNSTNVRLAEVFREPIRQGAVSIALVHNHPSGDPTPSPEDVRLTREVHDAGKLLDIDVLDHLVVGHGTNRFVSMKRAQLGFPVNGRTP